MSGHIMETRAKASLQMHSKEPMPHSISKSSREPRVNLSGLKMRPKPTFRRRIRLLLRALGFRLIRTGNPLIPSLDRIPPIQFHLETGDPARYYLPHGYHSRTEEAYFNDIEEWDEYQKEVYEIARMCGDRDACHTVCDVGCGSAYKLLTNFHDYRHLIGVDVPPTVAWLAHQYPTFTWRVEDFSKPSTIKADLVIASDIIEHLLEPNLLLRYIMSIEPQLIVLSTPERNLLLNGRHFGPPGNPAHVREWSYLDFHHYISDHFHILEHFVVNPFRATQMVIARLR
jgi:hypothetical protein